MKIAIACGTKAAFNLLSPRTSGLGGIETACIELARALAARGHAVTLLSRTDQPAEEDGVTNLGWEALGQVEADAVLAAADARLFDQARPALRVLWLHNPLAVEKAVRRGQLGPFRRHRPHAVFGGVVAERAMSRLYPFASRNVIPLGVSAEFLAARPDRRRDLRYVWVSQAQRGLGETLEAWRAALPRLPEAASFHVFGADPAEWVPDPAEARRRRIEFLPRRTKAALAGFYETATAMVYPGAADETFCLAAAEAQCVGLPVITRGIGSLIERVQNGFNGLVCPDRQQVAEAMVALAGDAELAALLRQGALQLRPLAGWDRVAKLWEVLLTRLL